MPDLSVKIGRLKLKNPVMAASGTFGYAEEFKDFIDFKKLGAIITKTITLKPRQGNPPPRTCETPAGMLNSIGLENPGLEVFLKDKLPGLIKTGVPIIVSIASETNPDEFVILAERLDKIKTVAAIELNISCPNIKSQVAPRLRSGQAGRRSQVCNMRPLISQDAKATYNLVSAVRKVTRKTLIAKLSPNVTDISEVARAAEKAGADALSLINTLYGMSIDIDKRASRLGNTIGGLSGPAIKPVALAMVYKVARDVNLPVIGMGGIMDSRDALEFIIAGASAVCVGTANFINPRASIEIVSGLKKYLQKNKIASINKLIGSLRCGN
jgi:dihydroorotate dehydrogenase (NAD+) catalytic subunit